MSLLAFDLDGTLLDTYDAVKEAYFLAGCTPPADFFQRSWQEWLKDESVHDRKNTIYARLIEEKVTQTFLVDIYEKCGSRIILSSCSAEAFVSLEKVFNLRPDLIRTGLSLDQRLEELIDLGTGIYFDDSAVTIEAVKKHTEWMTCHVQLR